MQLSLGKKMQIKQDLRIHQGIASDKDYPINMRMVSKRKAMDALNQLLAAAKAPPLPSPAKAMGKVKEKGKAFMEQWGIDPAAITPEAIEQTYRAELDKLIGTPEFSEALLHDYRKFSGIDENYFINEVYPELRELSFAKVAGSGLVGQRTYNMLKEARHKVHREQGAAIEFAIKELIDKSPVSQREATERARAVEFSEKAEKTLRGQRKGDYRGKHTAIPLLQQDMADFIQLTGGMAGINRFIFDKPRASYFNRSNSVNVGKGLTKKVLWHELAHAIEYQNPAILEASKGFLFDRLEQAKAEGSGIKTLRKIYKNNAYDKDEIAIHDGAFDHYVTKIYRLDTSKPVTEENIRSSEVLSMGIERLTDPLLAGKFLAEDPDHFAFVMGVLAELRGEGNDPTETD